MIRQFLAALLAGLLIFAPFEAYASQANLYSATTGTVSGLSLTNNFNNALDALNTANSGSTAPTNQLSGTPSLGNLWLNSTGSPYPYQIYDGSTTWVTPFWIDSVNHVTNVKIGGGVASVASASSVDLCSAALAPRAYITITGTTTVNSFGSSCNAGHVKIVTFAGSLTLTYNATSMIIPGAGNVQTSAGDQAVLVSLGSGNWQVIAYTLATGQALINPAIDVGDVVMTFLNAPPSSKYLFAYGQAISRSTYATLLAGLTIVQSVTATNGSPTLTGFSDTTQIPAGAAIEASFVPNGTTITSCTSTTCTMSGNASSSTTGNATIFPLGNGCGFGTSCASPSTTFNMPDCRDIVLAGRGNMGGTPRSDSYQMTSTYFGASPNALGVFGGSQSYTQQRSDMPNVSPTFTGSASGQSFAYSGNSAVVQFGSSGPGGSWIQTLNTAATAAPSGTISSINGNVTQTAMPRIPPTLTANCMMRVLTMRLPAAHLTANDNRREPLAFVDRRRRAA